MAFPPKPVYPNAIDSDRTLYLVFNTAETVTTSDNPPWSEEVEIVPVKADADELWATNGFANIEGELFYYDSVETDDNGKINKLKRCARNISGTHTKFNPAGSEVRGYVVAEHHNQIVDAIINLESFIGENFSSDTSTLDWRIRNLQELPVIYDDFSCPDVSFTFDIISNDPATGTIAQYLIQVNGSFTSYRLDFGDGDFTTSSTSGTHRYSTGATIDPVITVSNSKCTLVQSPAERTVVKEPTTPELVTTFEIKVPTIPEIPDFVFPSIIQPDNKYNIPPIVFPCLDIGPIGPLNIPSVITFEPAINIPTMIHFDSINIPTFISIQNPHLPNPISFTNPHIPNPISFTNPHIPPIISVIGSSIPDTITVTGGFSIPTLINITPVYIPTLISITPVHIPTFISITGRLMFPTFISITGPRFYPTLISIAGPRYYPTLISIAGPRVYPTLISIAGPHVYPTLISITGPHTFPTLISVTNPRFPSLISILVSIHFPRYLLVSFAHAPVISVNWGTPPTCLVSFICPGGGGGFRARENLIDNNFQDSFSQTTPVDMGFGMPSEIHVVVPKMPDIRVIHDIPIMIDVNVPEIPNIEIKGPERPLPSEIIIVNTVPSIISVITTGFPSSIAIDASAIPQTLPLEVPDNFPTSIKLDASELPQEIKVVGIPSTIEIVGNIPSKIQLVMPEKPEIELVYRGAPIDVKIQLDTTKLTDSEHGPNCVAIVPCSKS